MEVCWAIPNNKNNPAKLMPNITNEMMASMRVNPD
jgi:hypothetical protein